MSSDGSLKKNFVLNIIYQGLNILMPFFTAPYLARVLGVDGIGSYSYINSVSQFFVIFILLGLANYGNRAISRVKNDKNERSIVFWEIYYMQLLCGVIAVLIYFLFLFSINDSKMRLCSLIQVLVLFSSLLDVSWFYYGMEKYKRIISRSLIIRIVTFGLTFVLIKDTNDLTKYILLMGLQLCAISISLWLFIWKDILYVKPKIHGIIKHIKGNILLFIPILAISIYRYMDKIMLGAISGEYQVGLYESSDKIINIVQVFYTALGTVMLSRMCSLVNTNNQDFRLINRYMTSSLKLVTTFSAAAFWGIVAIANVFVPVYYGEKYYESVILLIGLAPILIVSPWKLIIRTHFLIPLDKNKSYILSVFAGAIINMIVNAILIPSYGAWGAVIGTLFAEGVSTLIQVLAICRYIRILDFVKEMIPFYIIGFIMYGLVKILSSHLEYRVLYLLLEIFVGAVIYGGLVFILIRLVKKQSISDYFSYDALDKK